MTKSVVGCVAGILLDRGVLDESEPVDQYVPELASSGYAGATVRHLLDMRSGARFLEDYTDPSAEIRQLDEWLLGERGLYAYLRTLGAERRTGVTSSTLLGDRRPRLGVRAGLGLPHGRADREARLGADGRRDDAEIMCDRIGTAVHDGGLSATARDLLRFGQLLLSGGAVPAEGGSRAVLPPRWLRQAGRSTRTSARRSSSRPRSATFPGGWYRNQFWFRVGQYGDVLLCLGIHGQLVYVSRRTRRSA